MKNILEYVILIVIIIVLAVGYGWQRGNARKKTDGLPQTPVFAVQDLTRIEIKTSESELTMIRAADGQWLLEPYGYPVEERLSAIMEEGLANFKLTAIVSESAADYARYELDDAKKVAVKAYTGEIKVLDLDLGSAVLGNFRHNYVKMAGNPNVYHGRGNLRTFFDTNEFELRQKQVFNFDHSAIDKIVLTMGGVERRVQSTRTKDIDGNEIIIWLGPDNEYIDSGLVADFLGFAGSTNVYEFLPQDKDDFGPTVYILTLMTNNGTPPHVLRIYEPDPEVVFEDEYSVLFNAVSSDVLSPFQLTYAQQSDLIKRFEDMLKPLENADESAPSGQLRVENLPEE